MATYVEGAKVLALRPGSTQFWGPAKIVSVKDDGYVVFFLGEPKTHYTVELSHIRDRVGGRPKPKVLPVIDLTVELEPKQHYPLSRVTYSATGDALPLDPYSPPENDDWNPQLDPPSPRRARPSFGCSNLGAGFYVDRNRTDALGTRHYSRTEDASFYVDRNRSGDVANATARYPPRRCKSVNKGPRYFERSSVAIDPTETEDLHTRGHANRDEHVNAVRDVLERNALDQFDKRLDDVMNDRHPALGTPFVRAPVSPNRAREIEKRLDDAMNNRHPEGWLTHMSLGIGRDNGRSGWRHELERRRISREQKEKERVKLRERKTAERAATIREKPTISSLLSSETESDSGDESDECSSDESDFEVILHPSQNKAKQVQRKRPPVARKTPVAKRQHTPSRCSSTVINLDETFTPSEDSLPPDVDVEVLDVEEVVVAKRAAPPTRVAPNNRGVPRDKSVVQMRARKNVLMHDNVFVESRRPRSKSVSFTLAEAQKRLHQQVRAARAARKELQNYAAVDAGNRYNLRRRRTPGEGDAESDVEDFWELVIAMRLAVAARESNTNTVTTFPPAWIKNVRRGKGRRKSAPIRNAGHPAVATLAAVDHEITRLRYARNSVTDVKAQGGVITVNDSVGVKCMCNPLASVPRATLRVRCDVCASTFHLWCSGYTRATVMQILNGRSKQSCVDCADELVRFQNKKCTRRKSRILVPPIAVALLPAGRKRNETMRPCIRDVLTQSKIRRMAKNIDLLRMGVVPRPALDGPIRRLLWQ